MDAQLQIEGAAAVLALRGRFDNYGVPAAAELLERAAQPPARLVVDLAEVDFVDSTALAALVQALKRCRANGGDLYLCGLRRPVSMIFELTRLDRAFQMFGDRAQALRAFGAAGGADATPHRGEP